MKSPIAVRVLAAAIALTAATSCSDSAAPRVDKTIEVEELRFFPKDVSVAPGGKVRWVNVERRSSETTRTVTSGTGPDDPEAGELFDVVLRGFEAGEAEGEDFIFTFDVEVGDYPYFSRLPEDKPFSGTVTVSPQ